MDHFLSGIPTWIITALVAFMSMGIAWGYFKSEVTHLKKEQEKHATKIENLASQKLDLGFKIDCGDFRQKCQDQGILKLDEIKTAIEKDKESVLSKLDELKEFIGYVKRVIENFDTKNNKK